jgi:hypothetical protein
METAALSPAAVTSQYQPAVATAAVEHVKDNSATQPSVSKRKKPEVGQSELHLLLNIVAAAHFIPADKNPRPRP